ncbi:MAG TPA: MlaD family protein [Steroidobacteraceae bacterium]|nr:MlaD family protein [Steroidobacteraceae bacterium]
MERDAKYATVALFTLGCVLAALAFVWWYSGRGDRRDYDTYEIYFEGTVSGLSKGSPVRYLGVDVGRVTSLKVDKDDPRRVKIVADIDSTAPVSGATQAKLGLLGLTGLLYIDLEQDPSVPGIKRFAQGEKYPVIASRKGTIEASVERLPQILGQASAIMTRIERILADENVRALGATLANIEEASAQLPATMADVQALTSDLRKVSTQTLELTSRLDGTLQQTQPELAAVMANARVASEKLARAADGIDGLFNGNGGSLGRSAGVSVAELQQLMIDARDASAEVRSLARELRERPSSLVLQPAPSGVEMPR